MRRASAVVLLVNPFTPACPSGLGPGIVCSCYNIMKCVYLHVRVCIRIIPCALCSDDPGKWNAIVVMLTKTAYLHINAGRRLEGTFPQGWSSSLCVCVCVVIIIILCYVSFYILLFHTASSVPYYHAYISDIAFVLIHLYIIQ